MSDRRSPYDQRLARLVIRPFASTSLHPNHVTFLSLLLGLASGVTFAVGPTGSEHFAALLFMLAVLCDHMDGELARMTGRTSRFGHYFDYVAGALNYTFLFCGLGFGVHAATDLDWALWIGLSAGLSNLLIVIGRLLIEERHGAQAVEHPASSGFEIEDFIYLIGPITWSGGVVYFFWIYAVGTLGYLLWTAADLARREVRRGSVTGK